MAKNNNVKDFAKDIADAIRAKENSVAKINPQDFSARIAALSVGGSPKFAELVSGTLTTIEESDLKDVTYISENAFSGLSYLTSVSIPSNVKTIGKNAFSTCQSIEVLNLSDGLEHIQDGAFSGVPLQNLVLPNTLKTVGKLAFVDAYIDTITIPASVESISDYAFCAGHEMQAVTIESLTPFAIGTRSFPTTAQIYVPYGAYDDYVASWTDYASQIVRLPAIPSTITVIVNDYTGALVSGASVTISGNGQEYTGTTDGVGTFTQGDLQPATYTISVTDMAGYKTPEVSEVVVEEDTQNSVTVTYLEKPAMGAFGETDWNTIAQVSAEISANNMTSEQVASTYGWNLGDIKSETLSTGEVVEIQIIGYNHDDKSDKSGKAGITLQLKNCLNTAYKWHKSRSSIGWKDCELRTATLPTVKATLSQELQNNIKPILKISSERGYGTTTTTTTDDLFCLSTKEMGYALTYTQNGDKEGVTYEYWDGKVNQDKIKYNTTTGRAVKWWLRSMRSNDGDNVCDVYESGGQGVDYMDYSQRVSFAFCI